MPARRTSLLVLLPILATTLACRAQEDAFYEKVFTCDLRASQDPCGTTRAGEPMTCFAASQLSGDDFCVPACNPADHAETPNSKCLSSGARLQTCRPAATTSDGSGGCPSGLQCYRTDLTRDEGLCIKMRICSEHSDCSGDPTRRACAGAILRDLYSSAPLLTTNLQCVQPTCKSLGSSCPPGEFCLADLLSRGPDFPEICVPSCDVNLHCPPNYSCIVSRLPSGPTAICIPGLLGTRCLADEDCLIGACLDTGAGFSECTIPLACSSDSSCGPLNGFLGSVVCAAASPSSDRHCVTLNSFRGPDCTTDSYCAADQMCFSYSPYGIPKGECRLPCSADLTCPARGGIPHVCLGDGAGGCYPSDFGMPCSTSSDCLSAFSCQAVTPDERTIITAPKICTVSGETDADCASMTWIHGFGFCRDHLCRLSGQQDAPCDRNEQCLRHLCLAGRCAI